MISGPTVINAKHRTTGHHTRAAIYEMNPVEVDAFVSTGKQDVA